MTLFRSKVFHHRTPTGRRRPRLARARRDPNYDGTVPFSSGRRRSVLALVAAAIVVTGCQGPSALLKAVDHPADTVGVTQKLGTIKMCAGVLSDIQSAGQVAARAGAGVTSVPKLNIGPLVTVLEKQAAANPSLPISRTINQLVASLKGLERASKSSPADVATAAQAVTTSVEAVVKTCASLGA